MEKDTALNFKTELYKAIDDICAKYNIENFDITKEECLKDSILPFIEPELKDDFCKLILLGEVVTIGEIKCKIIDWNPSSSKDYPIIYKSLSNGWKYKCDGYFMARHFNDSLKLMNKKAKEILARME